MTPTHTLFSTTGPLAFKEGMSTEQALQSLYTWAHTFDSLDPYQLDYTPGTEVQDLAKLVEDVRKLLK